MSVLCSFSHVSDKIININSMFRPFKQYVNHFRFASDDLIFACMIEICLLTEKVVLNLPNSGWV